MRGRLLACQAWSLWDQGCWAVGQAMLAAAGSGDQSALGWTHAILGLYGTLTGGHGADRAHQRQALDHFRRSGDVPGLAWAYLFAARPPPAPAWANAAGLAGQALALFRQARNLYGQRSALVVLAECHAHLGNYDPARHCAQQALELRPPAAGDSPNLALAWSVLGLARSRLGEHHQAISCYRQAVDLAQEWKTRRPAGG